MKRPKKGGVRPGAGPALRTDVVDVYVFRRRHGGTKALAAASDTVKRRRAPAVIEFLQLLRADEPLKGTWHPVMGHCRAGETAAGTARREMEEEVGLRAGDRDWLGFWALEQVHPFFIARLDVIVLSPRFAVEVRAGWDPRLNGEHTEWRWVPLEKVETCAVWPGQRACMEEIARSLLADKSVSRELLRIPI